MSTAAISPEAQREEATAKLVAAVGEYTTKKNARKRHKVVENQDFHFDRDGFIQDMSRYVVSNKKFDTKAMSSIIYRHLFTGGDMGIAPEKIRKAIEDAFTPELVHILENQTKHIQNKMLKENAWEGIRKPTDLKLFCSTIAAICKFVFYSVAEKFRSSKIANHIYEIADKVEDEKDWAVAVESNLRKKLDENKQKVDRLGEAGINANAEEKATVDFVSAVEKMTKHIAKIEERERIEAEEAARRAAQPSLSKRAMGALKGLGKRLRGARVKEQDKQRTSQTPRQPNDPQRKR